MGPSSRAAPRGRRDAAHRGCLMRFSVHIPTAAAGLAHPVPFASLDDILRIADAAERLGYDGVWGNDHVTTQAYVRERWPDPPDYFDTLVVLAGDRYAHDPARARDGAPAPDDVPSAALAKQVATLDVLSGGRFPPRPRRRRLPRGVRGSLAGPPCGQPGRWLDETLEGLRALFADRRASFNGEYVRFEGDLFPRPLQDPLPIYVGGHNLRAIERAAKVGHCWLPGWQPQAEFRRRIEYLRAQLRPQDARPMPSRSRPNSA